MLRSQQKIAARLRDLVPGKVVSTPMLSYVPAGRYYWTGSGREALRQILLHLQGKSEKMLRVGVPAYTCQVVGEAARRAGCEVVLYDCDVICTLEDIIPIIRNVDVLLVSYNFGFVPPMNDIAALCERNKVILIEDCAQALGAKLDGKIAGSFGSYAFYSFGISKNVGFCGGLIVSRDEFKLQGLLPFPSKELAKLVGKVAVSPLFFHKMLYPVTRKALQGELHKEHAGMPYDCPMYARHVIFRQMMRYSQIFDLRARNGLYCLKNIKRLEIVRPRWGESAWLYFVIKSSRSQELELKLRSVGVEMGPMYTFCCKDEGCPRASDTSKQVLTFSLNRSEKEIAFIVKKINAVCATGEFEKTKDDVVIAGAQEKISEKTFEKRADTISEKVSESSR